MILHLCVEIGSLWTFENVYYLPRPYTYARKTVLKPYRTVCGPKKRLAGLYFYFIYFLQVGADKKIQENFSIVF